MLKDDKMPASNLKQEIGNLEKRWNKLLFLCNRNQQFKTTLPIIDKLQEVNVNHVISEGLLYINDSNYPFHIKEVLLSVLNDSTQTYYLKHIDILFDPSLKIHPIRMLESISKEYKLVVEWPGIYEENNLIYAEHGHPEYFTCRDFEGKVIIK